MRRSGLFVWPSFFSFFLFWEASAPLAWWSANEVIKFSECQSQSPKAKPEPQSENPEKGVGNRESAFCTVGPELPLMMEMMMGQSPWLHNHNHTKPPRSRRCVLVCGGSLRYNDTILLCCPSIRLKSKCISPGRSSGFSLCFCVCVFAGENNSALFWALRATQKVMIKLCCGSVERQRVPAAMSQGS